MKRLLSLRWRTVWILFVIADGICIGMGMGVPVFSIMLGFPAGWYFTRRVLARGESAETALGESVAPSLVSAAVTFVCMAVIWGPSITLVFDPTFNFSEYGHPFILYDPFVSFIGWLVLMIVISPFLQLLATVFASHATLVIHLRNRRADTTASRA